MIENVLISEALHEAGMKLLEPKSFRLVTPEDTGQQAFDALLPEADAVILRTNVKLKQENLGSAGRLKIVARTGAGVDNVDVDAATERGIVVCNLVGVNSVSVAEHAVSLLLSLAKQLPYFDRSVRAGDWQSRRSKASVEVEGKVLGVAAMGNVGARVARICHDALGMKVLAYDPFVSEKFKEFDYHFVDDLPSLFRDSDFITLHLPSVPETKNVVNEKLLSEMKPSAYLINTARGDIIDEEALAAALSERRIAGAGIDVFAGEPPGSGHPFLGLDNVILTPHVASLTQEVTAKAAAGAARAIVDFSEGREPESVVNAAALGR